MSQGIVEIDGIRIEIVEVNKNVKMDCNNCWNTKNCNLKKKCSICPTENELISTEVVIALTNSSNKNISIQSGMWELMDSEGFTCGGKSYCENFMRHKTVNPDTWSVTSGTKVKFSLAFPEMEKNLDVVALNYSLNSNVFKIEIGQIPNEISKMFYSFDKQSFYMQNDYEFKKAITNLECLKKEVFIRLHNILTPKEQIITDNNIMNLEFEINEFLKKTSNSRVEMILPEFEKVLLEYNGNIDALKSREKRTKLISQKVEQLHELTPREFEEWTVSLFEALNYQNIVLTPQSNDKGIDLFAEKNGIKIAIQCKRFKGVVGSPTFQSFLGAMQTANVEKGIFITTGTFSISTEKMAENMPVELYDKFSLTGLIEDVLNKPN